MSTQFVTCFRSILVAGICLSLVSTGLGQDSKSDEKNNDGMSLIRGQVTNGKTRIESGDGNRLVIPYQEIEAKIRERAILPPPPYPADFEKRSADKRIEWEQEFLKTPAGKEYLKKRKSLIENANVFDVKFEKDGKFVIFDVPTGTYGIQGRTDKEINGKKYSFEVFGEVPVEKGMDEIKLAMMRVEVTPLIQNGEEAPPVALETDNDLKDARFKNKMVFLNFWYSKSPTAGIEQKMIQDMYASLKDKYPIELVSICVDEKQDEAKEFIEKNSLQGDQRFTDGFENRTIFDYGVRRYPSFWLIGADRKVMMTQYEIASAMRIKPDMKTIVEERILGKDEPTPAKPAKAQ